ncbi:MAG TPA: hypothetical protein VFJ74_10130 [Gemmatimonadaceae bacterium]|nr:hypothetical protein [Gemmatimonadaceae bacterium]
MPKIQFSDLPPSARVWVFAAERPVTGAAAERLLAEVDGFLARWSAHGEPLTAAREWQDDRFLTIGVDQSTAGASGCSIDGLFRTLRSLEPVLGTTLVAGGRVYYRDVSGEVRTASRDEFSDLASRGAVTRSTRVFDPTVPTRGEWDARFETVAGESWHVTLLA